MLKTQRHFIKYKIEEKHQIVLFEKLEPGNGFFYSWKITDFLTDETFASALVIWLKVCTGIKWKGFRGWSSKLWKKASAWTVRPRCNNSSVSQRTSKLNIKIFLHSFFQIHNVTHVTTRNQTWISSLINTVSLATRACCYFLCKSEVNIWSSVCVWGNDLWSHEVRKDQRR